MFRMSNFDLKLFNNSSLAKSSNVCQDCVECVPSLCQDAKDINYMLGRISELKIRQATADICHHKVFENINHIFRSITLKSPIFMTISVIRPWASYAQPQTKPGPAALWSDQCPELVPIYELTNAS